MNSMEPPGSAEISQMASILCFEELGGYIIHHNFFGEIIYSTDEENVKLNEMKNWLVTMPG